MSCTQIVSEAAFEKDWSEIDRYMKYNFFELKNRHRISLLLRTICMCVYVCMCWLPCTYGPMSFRSRLLPRQGNAIKFVSC